MILIGQDICEKLNVKEINKSEEDFIIKIIKIKKVFKYNYLLNIIIIYNFKRYIYIFLRKDFSVLGLFLHTNCNAIKFKKFFEFQK